MKRLLFILTALLWAVSSNAAIIVQAGNGASSRIYTSLSQVVNLPNVKKVTVTSPLSAAFSNISSATVHEWPADKELVFERGGSIANTTTFKYSGDTSRWPLARLFTGTGSIVFGSPQKVPPEWWGVTGTNDETPINKAIASLSTVGGTVNLSKDYYIDTNGITAASGVTITSHAQGTIGVGAANIHGGALVNRRTSGGAIVVGDLIHNFEVSHIGMRGPDAITPGETTNKYGIEFIVATSTRNVNIISNNFYHLDKCIYDNDPGTDTDVSNIVIERNQINECNYFVHSKSVNFEAKILHNDINYFVDAIYLERANLITIEKNISAAASGVAGNCFVKAGYLGAPIHIKGNNNEQCEYSFRSVSTSYHLVAPVNIESNVFSGKVTFDGGRNALSVNSIGNHYWGDFELTNGQTIVNSINDHFSNGKDFVITPSTNSFLTTLIRDGRVKYFVTGDDNQANASKAEVQLTTTGDTVIASLIPWANAGANAVMYRIHYTYFVLNASTNVQIHLTWNDQIGSHDVDLVPSALKTVGSYVGEVVTVQAVNGGAAIPINVKAIAGTANNVYVTAAIVPVIF